VGTLAAERKIKLQAAVEQLPTGLMWAPFPHCFAFSSLSLITVAHFSESDNSGAIMQLRVFDYSFQLYI
jgi:hypothetical protein